MKRIAIYTLTSELHDEQAVSAVTNEFLSSLPIDYDFRGCDFSDYGSHPLSLIFVRTGGTEGIFLRLLSSLNSKLTTHSKQSSPFYLLASGKSNSLAASMEILSYLQQNGLQGEILHGAPEYITRRIRLLAQVEEARMKLRGSRLGIVGAPSDWLISSQANKEVVKERLGIELIDIPMQELLDTIAATPLDSTLCPMPECCDPDLCASLPNGIRKSLSGAHQIYKALKTLISNHQLQGFTLRCFDLLSAVHNTGCLALARLNAEGIVAGCEGDVPAMLSMSISQALTGVSGFQANPARINPETGEILFAHCTIPLNMVERYEFDTHFESGIGVGIRGYMKEGPVTIFKVSGDLTRCFVEEGELVKNQAQPDLCRTQQIIRLSDPSKAHYFLTHPIGNHHIIVNGHHKALLQAVIGTAAQSSLLDS
ncbi:MAG: hypothetical protein IKX59_02885 [Bacteroidales bacterium]|nr:hypothetical protein [Bacteroidales bacterium]